MHGGLSAAPSWFGGALLPHEICRGSFSILGVLLGALLYKLGKLHYPTASQDTKNTTTHNNQHERRRPTHQRLWSSLSMATSAIDLDLGAVAPYGSEAAVGCSVRSRHCRFS
jgi:hypothetical protein